MDVPPTLSARVRLLDAGCTDKTDPHDARAAAIVALRHTRLRQVTPVDHTAVLRLLADRHHDLTGLRTQAICRLHALLCGLTPGGAGRLLSAIVDLFTYDFHFELCETIAPTNAGLRHGAEWRLVIFHAKTHDDVHADTGRSTRAADEAACACAAAIRRRLRSDEPDPDDVVRLLPGQAAIMPATAGTASKAKSPPTSSAVTTRHGTQPAKRTTSDGSTFVTSCHEVMTGDVSRRGSGGT